MEKKVKILMERYELGKLLGEGNFAKVYYARDTKTNRNVAIKVIDKETVLKVGLDVQIKREISVMKMLRHANILQVYEVMASKSKIYIVLEYAKGGELFKRVAKGRLREDIARWIFQQLISAVHFCHNKGVYHRDLKLENLLLDEEGNLKVSDFGLSTLVELNDQDGLLRTVCGTPAYVAPEVINKKGYDGKNADIWSCGVILYAMLAGHLPFRDSNLNAIYRKIRRAEYKCPNWFPAEVRKLLAKILDPNPKTRITIAKIMENPWFMKGLGTKPMIVKSSKVAAESEQELAKFAIETDQEMGKFSHMNAFDIISLSSGFDLSGLFVGDQQREDVRFTSQQPVSVIMSKLKELASNMRLKVLKKDGGFFRLLRSGELGDDPLAVDVEVFELTTRLHLVELKKSGGDSLEYQKLLNDIRPSLNDIVYKWQRNHISMTI